MSVCHWVRWWGGGGGVSVKIKGESTPLCPSVFRAFLLFLVTHICFLSAPVSSSPLCAASFSFHFLLSYDPCISCFFSPSYQPIPRFSISNLFFSSPPLLLNLLLLPLFFLLLPFFTAPALLPLFVPLFHTFPPL